MKNNTLPGIIREEIARAGKIVNNVTGSVTNYPKGLLSNSQEMVRGESAAGSLVFTDDVVLTVTDFTELNGGTHSGNNTGDQIVPTAEAGATNNFLTAYDALTGAFSKSRPTWANIDKTTSDIADLTTKSHTSLSDIGTNTHAQIDTYISTTAPSSFLKLDQTTPQSVINGSPVMEGVQFDTTPSTTNVAEGLMRWNSTDRTLDLGMGDSGVVTQQIGQELFIMAVNKTGTLIPEGSVVYCAGRQGTRPKIALARSDSDTTSSVMGVVTQDIADNAEGFVTTFGYVRKIKTDYSTWAEGDSLWVSKTTAGSLTNVEPTAPHHADIVGTVGIVHATQGSILVDVHRHTTLESLSDINGTALATTGQIPVWDNTNKYFDFNFNINNYIPYTGNTHNIDLGIHNLTVDTSTLFVDSANHRVGIGTITPAAALEVKNTTTTAAIYLNSYGAAQIVCNDTLNSISYIIGTSALQSAAFVGSTTAHNFQIRTNNSTRLTIAKDTGYAGFGTTSPTACVHIKAGTATANSAPLKFTTGTLLTSPEAGAIEFSTDRFYATQTTGNTRKEIKLVDQYYAEMYTYENTTSIPIGTQNVYHAVAHAGFVAGALSGFTFVAGISGTIASVADYSGTVTGTILITNVAHGLATGDIITIDSTTNYNGTYSITKVTNNTFYVTKAYVSTQTGNWIMGSYLRCSTGSDGVYNLTWSNTALPAASNETFKFELNKGTTTLDNIASSNKYGTSGDYKNMGSSGIVTLASGDRIWLSCRNETSTADITIRHANINIIRL